MSHNKAALYHSNGYNAQAACEHCEDIIRHERWCQTLNSVVCYAYKIVVSADELAIGDAIIRTKELAVVIARPSLAPTSMA
jgi:hypothetical protein